MTVPDLAEAHRLGRDHGQQTGEVIDRPAVRQCWTRWADAEIEAYLRGRRWGAAAAQKEARHMAGPVNW